YLLAAYAIEAVSRLLTGRFERWLFWLVLGIDGAFLAGETYLSGGSAGPVRYLVFVYLTVITLLGSWRTGLATAVWQSVAQFAIFLAQRGHVLDGFANSAALAREWDRLAAFLAALWVLTIATVLLAAMNQRELDRRRSEVDRLVDLGRDLEN